MLQLISVISIGRTLTSLGRLRRAVVRGGLFDLYARDLRRRAPRASDIDSGSRA